MGGDYARFGVSWSDMADSALAWQAVLLRRTVARMRGDFDLVAMVEVEGGTGWRADAARPKQGER